jgi:hypothetical protein
MKKEAVLALNNLQAAVVKEMKIERQKTTRVYWIVGILSVASTTVMILSRIL